MANKGRKAPLGRRPNDPTGPAAKVAPPSVRRARARPTAPAGSQPARPPRVTTGKTAAIWLDDEDRAILRKASILALEQGLKPSGSLILRAALRMMPLSPHLMDWMQELIGRDGRKRRHQKQAGRGKEKI